MKFYDTSSLLRVWPMGISEQFATSSVVIQELESIKSSHSKDADTRYAARGASRMLDWSDNYEVVIRRKYHEEILVDRDLPITNDNLIVAAAFDYSSSTPDPTIFVSEDIVLRLTASKVFGLSVAGAECCAEEHYRGYQAVCLSDEEMSELYSNQSENRFGLLTNEYLVICNSSGECVDVEKWRGDSFVPLSKKTIKTVAFGDKIKPKDVYQQMMIDSILSNTITAVSGKAGSGKSLIALVTAMHLIETGKYDRLVILFNPTSVRGASKLGFYAGDMVDKAMQTSIGNILTSKFGDRCAVDIFLQQGKIKLVSMADVRGFEVRDNEILYITEAQNTNAPLLKLCLSRASQSAKIIIEGDYMSQVDDPMFDGSNNGMKRAIEILKGEDVFGCVELQNVWRSKIAELVERM